MSEVVIRPFVPGDARAFYELNRQWITTLFQMELSDEAVLSDPEGMIISPGGAIFVAELGGQVVGCVALVPLPDSCYDVAKMAVTPDVRRQGIGRKLLETAVAWGRKQDAKRLMLGSNTRLTPASRLYEAAGFRHLAAEERPISPYARADVFMELFLET